jgi:hypothetical protein
MKARRPKSNLLRILEAAAFLRCSKSHLARLIRAGQLTLVDIRDPARKRPRWRVTRASLEGFILRRTDCTRGKKFWPNLGGQAKANAAMRSPTLREDKVGRVGQRRKNPE